MSVASAGAKHSSDCVFVESTDGWRCIRCNYLQSIDGKLRRRCRIDYHSCIYRGSPTDELIECDSCSGKVLLKVFTCGVHGRCTLRKSFIASCDDCKEWENEEVSSGHPRSDVFARRE